MGFGVYSSVAGASALEIKFDVIANNMANSQTTGFKEVAVSFDSEVAQSLSEGSTSDEPALVG